MKRTRAVLVLLAVALGVVCSAYADYSVSHAGTWPKSWPAELEALRGRSRSLRGSLADVTLHEIPFADRGEFEAAWPHLLTIKTPGAPILLTRGPDTWLGSKIGDAGVRIHCPPGRSGEPVPPARPLPGQANPRTAWLHTNYIELVIDGRVVDLNRIPLPRDTPIIDERFPDASKAIPKGAVPGPADPPAAAPDPGPKSGR